jgi:hypothetical protein
LAGTPFNSAQTSSLRRTVSPSDAATQIRLPLESVTCTSSLPFILKDERETTLAFSGIFKV